MRDDSLRYWLASDDGFSQLAVVFPNRALATHFADAFIEHKTIAEGNPPLLFAAGVDSLGLSAYTRRCGW